MDGVVEGCWVIMHVIVGCCHRCCSRQCSPRLEQDWKGSGGKSSGRDLSRQHLLTLGFCRSCGRFWCFWFWNLLLPNGFAVLGELVVPTTCCFGSVIFI